MIIQKIKVTLILFGLFAQYGFISSSKKDLCKRESEFSQEERLFLIWAKHGNLENLKKYENLVDVNIHGVTGDTALHFSAGFFPNLTKYLLDNKKVDINMKNFWDQTALNIELREKGKNIEVIKKYLNRPDINIATITDTQRVNNIPANILNLIKQKIVDYLLNAINNKNKITGIARIKNLIKLLPGLRFKGEIITDSRGNNAAHIAAQAGNIDAFGFILAADPTLINSVNSAKQLPINLATNPDLIKKLIELCKS